MPRQLPLKVRQLTLRDRSRYLRRVSAVVLGVAGERVSPGRHYFDCEGVILACFDPRADGDGMLFPTPATSISRWMTSSRFLNRRTRRGLRFRGWTLHTLAPWEKSPNALGASARFTPAILSATRFASSSARRCSRPPKRDVVRSALSAAPGPAFHGSLKDHVE